MLTIVIACLGLFGLATYAAEQRIKEIGIRKVLGASVSSIVPMLSMDFVRLVIIAAAIAFPIAWWAMNNGCRILRTNQYKHGGCFLVARMLAF